jgi:hypothetical protein
MFHRFRWCYQPKASSLTLVRENSMGRALVPRTRRGHPPDLAFDSSE